MERSSSNQAVVDDLVYILRKTTANKTVNIIVPMSCPFSNKYDGIFLFTTLNFSLDKIMINSPHIELIRHFSSLFVTFLSGFAT